MTTWPVGAAQVPVPLTGLLGRADEVDQLTSLVVDPTVRLVTITGAGGCGKTRLATEVAQRTASDFDDGVGFVPLAAVNDPALVASEVALALGVAAASGPGRDVSTLCDALRGRRMLIVLDNFEHLTAGAVVLAELAACCPWTTLLVTSRRRLQLPGERVLPLQPLPVAAVEPGSAGPAIGPAVELFWERARAVQPALRSSPERAGAVAEIVARLDGLPLAIELAAARSRLLSPEAILERLDTMTWQVLGAPERERGDGRRGLDRAIAWSHDLLDERARILLRRLGVFEGSFSLEAAEAIVGENPSGPLAVDDVIDGLTTLVDLHLVEPDVDPLGGTRCTLLHTIRRFARDRLAEAGELDLVHRRHAAYFGAEAVAAAARIESQQERQAYEQIDALLPELRAAMAWLEARGRSIDARRIAISLGPYWSFRDKFFEGRRWLETSRDHAATPEEGLVIVRAVGWSAWLAVDSDPGAAVGRGAQLAGLERSRAAAEAADDSVAWLWASAHLAHALRLSGDADRADAVAEQAVERATATGLGWWQAELLHLRAAIAQQRNDRPQAVALARAAIEAANASGHERAGARALQTLAVNGGFGGESAAIERALRQVLARSEAFGDTKGAASTLGALGTGAIIAGDLPSAMAWFLHAIQLGRDSGYWHGAAIGVMGVAATAAFGGEPIAGARLHGALLVHLPVLRRRIGGGYVAAYERGMAATERTVGPRAYAAAVVEGETMTWAATLDDAGATAARLSRPTTEIDRRRSAPPDPGASRSALPTLTARELDVVRLMVAGHTNREIAAELFMSPKTAEHHTGRVYRKLCVRGRAQAVALAIERGLVDGRLAAG